MSTLYLDIGNSSVKMVAKKAGRWGVVEKIPHADMEILSQRINRDYREFDVLCCSVRKDLAGVLEKHLETEVFTLLTVPMEIGRASCRERVERAEFEVSCRKSM